MIKIISKKKQLIWGLAYNFGGLLKYHHGWEHGGRQTDVVLEEETRALSY